MLFRAKQSFIELYRASPPDSHQLHWLHDSLVIPPVMFTPGVISELIVRRCYRINFFTQDWSSSENWEGILNLEENPNPKYALTTM